MMSLLSQVQAAERTAGGAGAVNWPIDDLAAELMYNRTDAAGPFKEYDDEIDAALAPSFRYQYTVKPGRPAEYVAGRMFPALIDTGERRMWLTVNARNISGYPFLKVENATGATAGDKVGIRIPTSCGVPAEYNDLVVLDTLWNGNGIQLDIGDFDHVNNGQFTANADYWYLETLADPGNWVWQAGAVGTVGGATSGAFWQRSTNLLRPFVKGMKYLVDFKVSRSAGTITPQIGSTAGRSVDTTGYHRQYITAAEDDHELLFKGNGFNGSIDTVYVQPFYNEHISDGNFRHDPANCWSWTLGSGWTWAAGPPRALNAVAATATVVQFSDYLATPFVNNEIYTVLVFARDGAGGTIRPRIGVGEGHDVTPGAPSAVYEWQITADDYNGTLGLHFELVATGFTGTISFISVCKNEPDPNGDLEVILQQSDEA